MTLFTPGPVMVHQDVLNVLSRQPLYHHSDEFRALSANLWSSLKTIFQTSGRVVVLAGSGMTGLEASMSSLHQHGEKILVLENGRFGQRLTDIARVHGLQPVTLSVPWGQSITPDHVVDALRSEVDCRGLWFVHSETSTAVTIDAGGICAAARDLDNQLIIGMDGVASVGIHKVDMDAWDVDAVAAGIQKGFRCPPGLACVGLSKRAEERVNAVQSATYTIDLKRVIDSQDVGLFTWTPPTSLVAALEFASAQMLVEGLESRWQHHRQMAEILRTGLMKLDLALFGESTSDAVVAVEDIYADEFKQMMLADHSITIAGGQDQLAGKVFRIGTMGDLGVGDVQRLLASLEHVVAAVRSVQ